MSVRNLPSQPTPFIGREHELAEIARRLADPACRLLTLTGPGGIGKTRLAIEAALRLHEFTSGAYFVPLQPLTSPNFMVSTIADALNFAFYGEQDPKIQLLHYLRDQHLLLVLDNFEQLLDGTDLLPEILEYAPGVKLLVTSRERLQLREEWVFDVGGLPYPEQGMDVSLDDYSATQLFVQSARRAGHTLVGDGTPAIIQICQLVEGMPLALELAATWVHALTFEQIASEIAHSLDILETPGRNIEPRHRTMRAAFAPTWQRLLDEERDAFIKLSVFRGGFTRDAAADVTGASLRVLSALVSKSLLRMDGGRYDIHELLRQYGEERLDRAAEEAEQTRNRHCSFYARLLERQWPRLTGSEIKLALQDIQV